ncbi:unconventional myosin-XV isoform X2 [Periplaneta americana]|uniref:unconventional myosin-XV isoform X2 n=1 Tax=Periplaneta americana TaxID=6978 RepID=UPI0037E73240
MEAKTSQHTQPEKSPTSSSGGARRKSNIVEPFLRLQNKATSWSSKSESDLTRLGRSDEENKEKSDSVTSSSIASNSRTAVARDWMEMQNPTRKRREINNAVERISLVSGSTPHCCVHGNVKSKRRNSSNAMLDGFSVHSDITEYTVMKARPRMRRSTDNFPVDICNGYAVPFPIVKKEKQRSASVVEYGNIVTTLQSSEVKMKKMSSSENSSTVSERRVSVSSEASSICHCIGKQKFIEGHYKATYMCGIETGGRNEGSSSPEQVSQKVDSKPKTTPPTPTKDPSTTPQSNDTIANLTKKKYDSLPTPSARTKLKTVEDTGGHIYSNFVATNCLVHKFQVPISTPDESYYGNCTCSNFEDATGEHYATPDVGNCDDANRLRQHSRRTSKASSTASGTIRGSSKRGRDAGVPRLSELCVTVLINSPQVFTLTSLNGVRRRQDLGQTGVEDMIQLSDLNEASLLWNLKIRYDKELIYTYTGSILVAVNPYKMFDIYGLDMVKKYEGQILGTLPPHLFAIGSSAYGHMSKEGSSPESQVVVISGESGSGKTESTKLVMQYLAAVNKSPSNLITEQILEASPLLESFGNAKTVRNDNSSRFGKYLEVHFKDGVIIGAKITEYLLEKSRIVTQAPDERNYHVFYEMLQGLTSEAKEKYGLLSADKYFYLNQGGNCEIDGKFDGEDFQSLLSAMQVLGFTSDEQDTIFRILASVLHLGNVYFHRKQLKHGQEGVEIGSDAEIRWTGHLLHLSPDGIKRALTTKTTEARNERVVTPLSIDQALDARDAFAKALYNALFSWLVSRINQIVYKGTKRTAAISILDIFGFEDFKENSFEQLCINYANENLQFYFNKHIFKLEQQEYAKEKIEWQTISYTDNLPVIHLIAKKPVGILHLLDDESNFPKATDLSFLEKCHYNHALDELYSRPRMSSMEFAVKHYAGQVWYSVDGFLDKNRDTLRQDVVDLLISSKIQMVSKMFQNVRSSHEAAKTINKANGRFVTMKPRTPTVAARFHDSLQHLLESMSKCNPWFVRCIKPNSDKAPMKFDMPIVLEQLRYTGMLETIRIRKMGYPVRLRFAQFVERFRYLLPQRVGGLTRGTPYRELCRVILSSCCPEAEANGDYQLGTTRVFLRERLERELERERARVVRAAAVTMQKTVRGYLARRRYRATRKAALTLQAHVRGWVARKRYLAVRKGVVRAQANFRAIRQRRRYLELKEELKRRAEVEKLARERAKAKAQREEQERASRAVAGVNHLEIPAELAFIFSKLDDWQPIHSERHLVKVVGGVAGRSDTERHHLPHDIDSHAFTKFTNIYFKSHLWGMKREPIKTPFLAKSKDMDYQDSLALFKLILRFMNDNNLSGKKEVALGDYIVNKGIVNEKLRDEVLCQLCNQTWNNDNDANNERGWLLMANCLSVFPPSKTLYKYLLKYVSDHGYNGYKAVCQRKLLQSSRIEWQLARNYPPCLLEWRSNRKRVNMALQIYFADGEMVTVPVDSWTGAEELAGRAIRERGISENSGWTLSLSTGSDTADSPTDGLVKEINGLDYVMDLIAEMELAPAFPACRSSFLQSGGHSRGVRRHSNKASSPTVGADVEVDSEGPAPSSPRRPAVPPPEPPVVKQPARKVSHEVVKDVNQWGESSKNHRVRSQSRDHTVENALSRKSALNDRYFEDKGRSRSLDNLLESELPPPRKLDSLGLSHSRLNERYHSMEKVNTSHNDVSILLNAVSNKEYMTKAEALLEEQLESVSQRGESSHRKYSLLDNSRGGDQNLNGRSPSSGILDQLPSDLLSGGNNHRDDLDFDYPDLSSQARSEDDKGSYIKGHPRFIKSQYAGKRAAPGSHSSRAYIETRNSEKSDYGAKSSALSDTSEAPSLASHVRRVRVPSQASDVDQFLDDLFMPVLDGNLDELSDARSLAASIKGGGDLNKNEGDAQRRRRLSNSSSLVDDEVATLTGSSAASTLRWPSGRDESAENVDDYITDLFKPIFVNASLQRLTKAATLAGAIKGGGGMESHQTPQSQTTTAFGFTPIANMTSPTPVMMSGMMSPPPMMMPTIPLYTPAAQSSASLTYMGPAGGLAGAAQAMAAMPQFYSAPMSADQTGFMPIPIYNMQGLSLPTFPTPGLTPQAGQQQAGSPAVDPAVAAYQQNLQRAFLQSAMAQNIQIQQQLLAQNQALQQMLVQPALSAQQQQQQQHVTPGMHALSMSGAAPPLSHQMAGLMQPPPFDTLGRNSKVSFREPENGELWSTEKRVGSNTTMASVSTSMTLQQQIPVPPLPPKSRFNASSPYQQQSINFVKQETTVRAQVHRSQSPPNQLRLSPTRKLSPTKSPGSSTPQAAFTNVLSELKSRRSSTESGYSNKMISSGAPPPPPPPMPPPPEHMDPSETRPFLDPYGRAKTVRIGKWRWPPPKTEQDESSDSFLQFKMRQHQRKTTPQQQEFGELAEGIEWEEFEINGSPGAPSHERSPPGNAGVGRKDSRSGNAGHHSKRDGLLEGKDKNAIRAFEVGASRPSPGSIGKLRISSEMRTKLEMVTANHSLRASNKPEKPGVIPSKRDDSSPSSPHRPVKKLEDNRRLMLEQQLAGRWDSVDSVEAVTSTPLRAVNKEERSDVQQTNIVRSQVERMEKTTPRFEEKPSVISSNGAWDKTGISSSGWDKVGMSGSPWDKPGISGSAWDKSGIIGSGWDKASGWGEKNTSNNNSSNWRPAPPPPPVTPHFIDTAPPAASRASSFYSQGPNAALPQPRSPPPPIQPVKTNRDSAVYQHNNKQHANNRDMYTNAYNNSQYQHAGRGRDMFEQGGGVARIERDRRSSVSTHLTDRMERIEIEESPEFLQPVDTVPPLIMERRDHGKNLEMVKTKIFGPSTAAYFTYNRVTWRLNVRKEVFSPGEILSSPLALHLVFCQVVQDCLGPTNCIRITREQRAKMRKMLDSYGVTLNNLHSAHQKVTIKKNIVDMAKDWPVYFARIFPVSGGHQHPAVQQLAVSHSGVRLVRRDKGPSNSAEDTLQVLDTFSFEEISETCVPKGSAVQLVLTSGVRFLLYTHRANQIHAMIDKYCLDNDKLQQKAAPRVADGLVPSKIALDSWTGHSRSAGHQQQSSVLQPHSNSAVSQQQQQQHHQHQQQHHQQRSIITSSPQPPEPPGRHDGKHSLLQFAMLHFRQSPEKFEMLKTADGSISGSLKVIESLKTNKKSKGKKGNKENDWTWKEQVDLVKFSSIPIEQSLLRLEPGELSELAVECFAAVMRYMGDLPMAPDSTEVKCVYTILMHCHKHEALRDEVYCQLMKQTTNNKSMKPDSCQRGWRLFSIVAAYFVCSDTLKPYLFKYLETAAYDKRRAYHGTATVCLQNLRKTFKYGGRKNVPSVEEITAISAGRNSKRQIYRLPGGTERVVNTKSTTVVQDVIEELCTVIGVTGGEMEMEEFSLYCIVEGDTFTMPLAREEYILDVTTELHKNQQVFYLIFCRSVWHFPLRLDSQLYVEVVFNQIAPDYLEGLLLVMPGEQLDQDVIYDIAKMAALLHRAADMTHVPTMKETKFLLPKPALTVRDVKPAQWVNMVQSNWRDVETLTTIQSKAQVLDILSKWPLFGSSFFAVKRVSDPKERSDHILALNRHGVHFIDLVTHETLTHYPFSEVISTRKVKSEDGTLFLDMKCGNLMQQRITRLQTDQAHEISRLIRQYITMEQRLQQRSVA